MSPVNVCDKHCDAIHVKSDGSVAQQATINLLREARQQACQTCTMNCDNHPRLEEVQSGGSKRKYKKRRSGKKKRKTMKKKRKTMKKKRKTMKKKRKSIKRKR